jgi:hypothetical protein
MPMYWHKLYPMSTRGRPTDTMPERFPACPDFDRSVRGLPQVVRTLLCDAADLGVGQRAMARWAGISVWRVRTVLARNGKLRGSDLIYLGRP